MGSSDAVKGVRLAVTMGDPRGIGPEICARALAGGQLPTRVGVTVVGSLAVLRAAARTAGVRLNAQVLDRGARGLPECGISVLDLDNFPVSLLSPRKPSAPSGRASLDYIEKAVAIAMSGGADAVVTGPISKEAIGAAGSPHPGHTEMLAELTGAEKPVMMLLSGGLRVAFVTTHLALRDVPNAVTRGEIYNTGVALGEGLRKYFGVKQPRLAVCGLNPHCGDGGRFGDEEERIIAPAVADLRQGGLCVDGPLPSDTLFAKALAGDYDGVVALYHDQGMIAIKLSGVGGVVNVTLGLPIIRTSVGHGTAYDIAGRGFADESSLMEAIRLAAQMVRVSAGGKPE